MAINKIKSGDEVIVIAGRSKGRTGKVIKRVGTDRLLVEGVNMVKKHQKPNPQKQIQGGIVEREATIHVSNVAILNSATNTADRVGIKILEDGRKVRVYKSNNEVIDA